jgi:hypothetical protein
MAAAVAAAVLAAGTSAATARAFPDGEQVTTITPGSTRWWEVELDHGAVGRFLVRVGLDGEDTASDLVLTVLGSVIEEPPPLDVATPTPVPPDPGVERATGAGDLVAGAATVAGLLGAVAAVTAWRRPRQAQDSP